MASPEANTYASTAKVNAVSSLFEPSASTKSTHPTAESYQSSTNTSDGEDERRSRSNSRGLRPTLGPRKPSGTMIIPADHPDVEGKDEEYPPHDARAMSPRRSSADTDKMVEETRRIVESHALEKQSGINALIEKIENVKTDHDQLHRNNLALQDYIGGLHRSMSRTALGKGRRN
ncbi:hypothetical protein ABVK25_003960 [Lepraria finkii]|uniref:Uncharacterized protein n=1 Tax=Lepraria finkii TaxID=1340010 RepID=A0ABR4BFC9_9LECA